MKTTNRSVALPILIIIFSLLIIIPSIASAVNQTWYVDDNPLYTTEDGLTWDTAFTKIQDGIIKAGNGDTVLVREGTYDEWNITYDRKAITVKAEYTDNPEAYIVQSNGSNTVFLFNQGEYSSSVLDGFTIRNGQGSAGGGIKIRSYSSGDIQLASSPTIQNCIIRDNTTDSQGGGVYVSSDIDGKFSRPNFINCKFINNSGGVGDDGGAVFVANNGMPAFRNCLFTGNSIIGVDGRGAVARLVGTVTLITMVNCTIVDNETYRYGAGIKARHIVSIYNSALASTIINCIIRNPGLNGKEIHFDNGTQIVDHPPAVKHCNILNGNYDMDEEHGRRSDNYDFDSKFVPLQTGETYNFHLAMDSPDVNMGIAGTSDDLDGVQRPYALSDSWDIGAYEFNFCYLVDKDINNDGTWNAATGQWKVIDVAVESSWSAASVVDPNVSPGTTIQDFKVHFYRLDFSGAGSEGVLRIATKDTIPTPPEVKKYGNTYGYLMTASDCTSGVYLAEDDNSGEDGNFKIDYPYIDSAANTYYLAVKGHNTNPYDLYIWIQTDTEGNTCRLAETDDPAGTYYTFTDTFFNAGSPPAGMMKIPNETHNNGAQIDFEDDIDVYKIDLKVPGTLEITGINDPDDPKLVVVLRDMDYEVIQEGVEYGLTSVRADLYDLESCYVEIRKRPEVEFTAGISYDLTLNLFPPDDWHDVVTGAIRDPEWTENDISTKGSLEYDAVEGAFTITGNGAGINEPDATDQAYYVYKKTAGDFELEATVTALKTTEISSYEEVAGLMIRHSLSAGSKNVMNGLNPSECATGSNCGQEPDPPEKSRFTFRYRAKDGQPGAYADSFKPITIGTGTQGGLRIGREGNQFYSYYNNGSSWVGGEGNQLLTLEGIGNIFGDRTMVGMMVASYNTQPDYIKVSSGSPCGDPVCYYKARIDHTASDLNRPRVLMVNYETSAANQYQDYSFRTKQDYVEAHDINRPRLFSTSTNYRYHKAADRSYELKNGFNAPDPATATAQEMQDAIDFAIAHLPRKEFVNIGEVTGISNDDLKYSYRVIKDHDSVDSSTRPKIHIVSLDIDGKGQGSLREYVYRCVKDHTNQRPLADAGEDNPVDSEYWKYLRTTDNDGNVIPLSYTTGENYAPYWSSTTSYGAEQQVADGDGDPLWQVVAYNAGTDAWTSGTDISYGKDWRKYWTQLPKYDADYDDLADYDTSGDLQSSAMYTAPYNNLLRLHVLSAAGENWYTIARDVNLPDWGPAGTKYGKGWENYWRQTEGTLVISDPDTVADLATEWASGDPYETSQSAEAVFKDVTLDSRDILLYDASLVNHNGKSWRCIVDTSGSDPAPGTDDRWAELTDFYDGYPDWPAGSPYTASGNSVSVGYETGHITAKPAAIKTDSDVFELQLEKAGTLYVRTTGCTVGQEAEIELFNRFGEEIPVAGATIPGTGDYLIENAEILGVPENSPPIPLLLPADTYYLRVRPLDGHETPFKYGLYVKCTDSVDEIGNYIELAKNLTKWDIYDSPLSYFRQENCVANKKEDKDYFRFDVPGNTEYPNGAWVRIMADTENISVRLLNSAGGLITSKTPVNVTDPYTKESFLDVLEKHLTTGTYYIEVTSVPDSDVAYKLDVDLDDYGNLYNANPKPFKGYKNVLGHLETVSGTDPAAIADKDVFVLETASSANYVIYTEGTTNTSARILDSSGEEVALGDDYEEDIDPLTGNLNFRITKDDFSSGTYYVEITEKNGRVGDYRLFINLEDDYSNRYDCHAWNGTGWDNGLDVCSPPIGTLVVGTDASGVINQTGDIDYFRFDSGASPGAGRLTIISDSGIDTEGELYEYSFSTGRGRLCAMNTDGAGDSVGNFKIEYDVKANTTYLLKVKATLVGATGGYTLKVAHIDHNDPGAEHSPDDEGDGYNEAVDAFPLGLSTDNPSGSHTGAGIDLAGDNDYYEFDVIGTGILRVWTETASGVYTDTFGYLYVVTGADTLGGNGLCELVAMNDDDPEIHNYKDGNFSIRYYVDGNHKYSETDGVPAGETPGLPITKFFVRVKGLSDSTIGDYVLKFSFDTSTTDDEGNSCATAKAVGPDDHAGKIDLAGDIDYFRFVLGPDPSGATVTPGSLNAYSTSNNSLDLFGYLKNYMCSTLLMDDNSGTDENFSLNWQQSPPDSDIQPPPEPINFYNPEVYYVALRDYEGVNVDPYTLTINSNGTFIDFGYSADWAPTVAGSHYFGFEVPPTASTLSITCTNSPVATDFTLLSGEGGITSEVDDVVNNDTGNNFTIHHADIAPGFYYVMVTPTGTSTDPMTISVDSWRWEDGIFIDSSGSAGAFNKLNRLVNSTVFDMEATGTDIEGTSDSGYFAWRTVTGDFDISGRMTIIGSGNEWAKVGPMVRSSEYHNAANVFASYADTHGSHVQYRLADEAGTTTISDDNPGNRYARLVRSGNTVTAYKSTDGENWVYVYETDVFTGEVLVGFAATSHESTSRSFKIEEIKFSTKVSLYE